MRESVHYANAANAAQLTITANHEHGILPAHNIKTRQMQSHVISQDELELI